MPSWFRKLLIYFKRFASWMFGTECHTQGRDYTFNHWNSVMYCWVWSFLGIFWISFKAVDYNASVGQLLSRKFVMKTESLTAWLGIFPLIFWKLWLVKLLLLLAGIPVRPNKATLLFCLLCISRFLPSAIQTNSCTMWLWFPDTVSNKKKHFLFKRRNWIIYFLLMSFGHSASTLLRVLIAF